MTSSLRSGLRTIALLSAGLWLAAAGPAYLVAGSTAIEGLTLAVLICAVPGIIALFVAERSRQRDRALTGLLIGSGLRMAAVLVATLVLRQLRPDLGPLQFHAWLIVAYLAMLAVETKLVLAKEQLVRPRPRATVAG